jgi:drug/metabolite transporter (DMT)-like permease
MDAVKIGELAALGTAVLWTLSALAWTSAGKHMGALAVSFIRLVITCGFLAAYGGIIRGCWLPTDADGPTWQILGISGFVGFFLADVCLFKALLLIGPRLTLLVQSLSPPIAAILSWVVLRDGLAARHWFAMALTLSGVAWVVLERPDEPADDHAPRRLRHGVCLAVLAAAGQAIGLVLSKQGIGDYDAVGATFIRVLGGMAGFLVLITFMRRWPSVAVAARHSRAMVVVVWGSLVGPCIGVALCMIALRYCHAGVTATIISTTPVLILPFVILFYREKVSLRAVGGAVLSVVGVALLVLGQEEPSPGRAEDDRARQRAISFCENAGSKKVIGILTDRDISEPTPEPSAMSR